MDGWMDGWMPCGRTVSSARADMACRGEKKKKISRWRTRTASDLQGWSRACPILAPVQIGGNKDYQNSLRQRCDSKMSERSRTARPMFSAVPPTQTRKTGAGPGGISGEVVVPLMAMMIMMMMTDSEMIMYDTRPKPTSAHLQHTVAHTLRTKAQSAPWPETDLLAGRRLSKVPRRVAQWKTNRQRQSKQTSLGARTATDRASFWGAQPAEPERTPPVCEPSGTAAVPRTPHRVAGMRR